MPPESDNIEKLLKAADRKVERTESAFREAAEDRAKVYLEAKEKHGLGSRRIAKIVGRSNTRVAQILKAARAG